MNFNEIKELIQLLDKSELTSFQYQKDGLKLKIEKKELNTVIQTVAQTQLPQMVTAMASTSKTPAVSESANPLTAAESGQTEILESSPKVLDDSQASSGTWVKSPLVGVYYSAPNPSSPSFIEVGRTVKKGDVLCIIEAMKVMNEIVAEKDGVVLEIKPSNEQLVEFGEHLVRIG